MQVLNIHPENPQLRFINRAIEVLKDGGLIIYPTDTVYGLGCDIFHKQALERVYHIKKDLEKKPPSFICSDLKDIAKYAKISTVVYRTMRHALPGAYTFILPAAREVPKKLWSKRKSVGIRIPDNLISQLLAKELGTPIVSTSVTDANGEILNDEDSIKKYYGNIVDLMLYSGPIGLNPSTIVDYTDDTPEVIREGAGDISVFK
ncbi:MAG: threonylcarbamoyl-AMP synthase [Ignavibacteria bacterium]|nr:threonylcarbamoyl-AMP synthase [Ignavibacteria bacterium]